MRSDAIRLVCTRGKKERSRLLLTSPSRCRRNLVRSVLVAGGGLLDKRRTAFFEAGPYDDDFRLVLESPDCVRKTRRNTKFCLQIKK